MIPRIENFKETKIIGRKLGMSFANDRTRELWQNFSPRKKEIGNAVNYNLYSIEIYPNSTFFENFDVSMAYKKWAGIEVSDFDSLPDEMETFIIPKGLYAVFNYKGKPSDAQQTFQYIYGVWLPNSEYKMDDRPYFALMGEKYKGEDPESEEEFWIPIKIKKAES